MRRARTRAWFERGFPDRDDRFTTMIDVGDYLHHRRAALLAHRTQVDPEGFWMRLPDDVVRKVFPWEEYVLARSLVDTGVADGRARGRPVRRACGPRWMFLRSGRGTDGGESAMAKYLTQEWLDEARKLAEGQPERPGASAKMQYVVTGGPEGDIKYYWVLENGKLLESQLGELPDVDFTMTLTYDDSVKVQQGELDANAAFMQGRMKVTGNMGKLMQLMPLTNSPEYKALQEDDPRDHRVLIARSLRGRRARY